MSAPVAGATKADRRPWVEKFRPQTMDEVVAHEQILSTLKRFIANDSIPHLLFYGPPGTGKTTTIHALARHLFGTRLKGNVLEMNASDDRGIDIVRHQIKEFASTGTLFANKATTAAGVNSSLKLVVLDEADQMSGEAQAALRRVIEQFTKTVRFCILCNHVNKIIPAVQSRCTRFRFGPIREKLMVPRLLQVVSGEDIGGGIVEEAGIKAAYKLSSGDMRRCLNILQAAALATKEITEESVYRATGNPTPAEVQVLLESMLTKPFDEAWTDLQGMVQAKGLSAVDLVREVHPYIVVLDLPVDAKCFALAQLAEIEYNLAAGCSEAVACGAVLGAVQLVRESVTSGKSITELAPHFFKE